MNSSAVTFMFNVLKRPFSSVSVTVSIMKVLSSLILTVSIIGFGIGCVSLSVKALENYFFPLWLTLGGFSVIYSVAHRFSYGRWAWNYIALFILSFAAGALQRLMPEHFLWMQVNAIVHRSFIMALLVFAVTVPAACSAIFALFGATPRAQDISRYPLLLAPVLLVFSAYLVLIINIIVNGASNLDWEIIVNPFQWQSWYELVYKNGWPTRELMSLKQAGMRNHILGTLLLIGLTAAFSLPIGMCAGIFIHEYRRNKLSHLIRWSTTSLRVISLFILAIAAYGLVRHTSGTPISDLVAGYFYDIQGIRHTGHGSYLLAALFLSLLVIPIITRATEEGCCSVPKELKEASLAVGASDNHTLFHITIPWSLPNVITGLILGCAEVAGSVAVILFLAGSGQFGVGPLNEVTSLSFFIWDCEYGAMTFRKLMEPYQLSAALLLLFLTTLLTVTAFVLQRRFGKRYRGA